MKPLYFLMLTSVLAVSCSHRSGMAEPLSLAEVADMQKRADLEVQALREVNQLRQQHGLPPLQRHQGLDEMAARHAVHVARNIERGRTGGGKTTMHDGYRIRSQHAQRSMGVRLHGENVLAGTGLTSENPRNWINQWLASEAHRKQLLGGGRYSGLAVLRGPRGELSVVQLFGSPAGPGPSPGQTWWVH